MFLGKVLPGLNHLSYLGRLVDSAIVHNDHGVRARVLLHEIE
jgi:hypothetical protein